MDWAGILVERTSELRLDEYFAQNIFQPLGVRDLAMIASTAVVTRCSGIWQRRENGELSPRKYPLQKPFNDPEEENVFHSGGAGLYGSIKEFSSKF